MVLLVFALPVLAMAIYWARGVFKGTAVGRIPVTVSLQGSVPMLALLAIALGSTLVTVRLLSDVGSWPEHTEVAWTAARMARPSAALVIGGPQDSAVVAWPNGARWPQMSVETIGGTKAKVTVSGGGGVIRHDGQALNGIAISVGTSQRIGGVDVGVWCAHWLWCAPQVHVRLGQAHSAAPSPTQRKVMTFEGREQEDVARLRSVAQPDAAATALALETWSSQTVLSADDASGKVVRVAWTGTDMATLPSTTTEMELPAVLEIRWPDRVIEARVSRDSDGAPRIEFLPPWRRVSPLPPLAKDGSAMLTVTGDPRPGDFAFEMPFGHAIPDVRANVRLLKKGGRTAFIDGRTPSPASRGGMLPGNRLRTWLGPNVHDRTSSIEVRAGPLAVELSTVQDLLDPVAIRASVYIGFGMLLLFVLLASAGVADADQWPLCIISAALWQLLLIRYLLAVRYAMDPRALDTSGVRGLAVAAIALTVVLPLVWLGVRLYQHAHTLPARRRLKGNLVLPAALGNILLLFVLACAAAFQWFYITGLWPNLSARQMPSPTSIAGALGFVFLLFLVHALSLVRGLTRRDEVPRAAVLLWPQRIILEAERVLWDAVMRRPFRKYMYLTALVAIVGVVAAAISVTHFIINPVKLVQDFASPLLLVGVPVLLWLALLGGRTWRSRPDLAPSWWIVILLGFPLVLLPVLSPIVVADVGGVFATLAIIVPLGCFALALRLRRVGVVVLGYAAAALVAGTLLMAVLPVLHHSIVTAVQRGASRYLVFTLGDDAQGALPFAQLQNHVGNGIPVQSLQNAITHVWQNRAIAHSGGMSGWGYANAPTGQSGVPQHVLQFDSTFSFFIVPDHGLEGGIALLLLYAVPLAVVLISARRRFDLGHALAALIAASLLNEALIHAAMNLGGLPFTGRNLPLLSVDSITDLLRWVCLLVLMAQGVVWNSTSATPSVSPDVGMSMLGTPSTEPERGRPYVFAVASLVVPSLLLAGLVVGPASWRTWRDKGLEDAFTWRTYHAELQRLIDSGNLVWDAKARQIRADGLGIELEGDTVVEQEVVRFNSLPDEDKLEISPVLAANLKSVTSLASYDALMAQLRVASIRPSAGRRPPVFRVIQETRKDPATGDDEDIERLIVNPDISVSFKFTRDLTAGDVPQMSFKGRSDNEPGAALIGPAWVNGRWRSVRDAGADLPWLQGLGDIVARRWVDPEAAAKQFGVVTLDQALQRAAQSFVADKGRQRHAELLKAGSPGLDRSSSMLPPRVALSVIDLPTGRVLAMGGWPRTSASKRWEQLDSEWLPPASWLTSAPGAIARRYRGDRNFDRLEMGSASKPIWAFASLLVHPQLYRSLATQGPAGSESDVFGIPVRGKPWHATAAGWTKFDRYLSSSDNRFHIRLGFLGLADGDDKIIRVEGKSTSDHESMNGGSSRWGRTPGFPYDIGFAAEHPDTLRHVDQTPLARNLRDVFSAGVTKGDVRPYRLSFWTGDEADDLSTSLRRDDALAALSPEATQLRLDSLSSPRQFVSLLLGGEDNRWSNVEFAAEFATAVTGHPVVAHIADGVTPVPAKTRRVEAATAMNVRKGLAEAASAGTAAEALKSKGAWSLLTSIRGAKVYAKTGTLAIAEGVPETSRLVVAVIRWDNESKGIVKSGIVFSLVVERGYMGLAAKWLAEFIAEQAVAVRYFVAQ